MRLNRKLITLAILSITLLLTIVKFYAPDKSFQRIGFLTPKDKFSVAVSVSPNGKVVVGASGEAEDDTEAFRWENGQMQGLGGLNTDDNYSMAYGVSNDGKVVVGWSLNTDDDDEAFRWEKGQMQGLGGLNAKDKRSTAYAVNADGKVIVGGSINEKGQGEAFRWEHDKLIGLGFLAVNDNFSNANGVSANGKVVVGIDTHADSKIEAFRWVQNSNNQQGQMYGLGFLTANSKNSWATGVSAHGNVVIGNGDNAKGKLEAFRWVKNSNNQSGKMQALGFLNDNDRHSVANGVSANGKVVVGASTHVDGNSEAFRWENGHIQSVKQWLAAAGVKVASNVVFKNADATNKDGSVIVGQTADGGAYIARVKSSGGSSLSITSP